MKDYYDMQSYGRLLAIAEALETGLEEYWGCSTPDLGEALMEIREEYDERKKGLEKQMQAFRDRAKADPEGVIREGLLKAHEESPYFKPELGMTFATMDYVYLDEVADVDPYLLNHLTNIGIKDAKEREERLIADSTEYLEKEERENKLFYSNLKGYNGRVTATEIQDRDDKGAEDWDHIPFKDLDEKIFKVLIDNADKDKGDERP